MSILQVARDAVPYALKAYEPDIVSGKWRHGNAHGYLTYSEGQLHVGIAGTDSPETFLSDIMAVPRSLIDWSKFTGIPIAKYSHGVVSSKGLLDHLYDTYTGIERELDRLGIHAEEIHQASFYGHSLGGAMALLLSHTQTFEHARAVTFGCPKTYHKDSLTPIRIRYQVWQYQDPVPYLPFGYQHADNQPVILTLPGRVPHGSTPHSLRPFLAVAIGTVWVSRVWRAVMRLVGKDVKVFKSHSMRRHAELLGVEF